MIYAMYVITMLKTVSSAKQKKALRRLPAVLTKVSFGLYTS